MGMYRKTEKTEIEIIKNGKVMGRVSSIRKARKLTNVAEVFIANHLGDGVVSWDGYSFNRVAIPAKQRKGGHGRPVGYKCSDEVRKKMQEAARQRMQNLRLRRKISDALSDYWIKRKKKEKKNR